MRQALMWSNNDSSGMGRAVLTVSDDAGVRIGVCTASTSPSAAHWTCTLTIEVVDVMDVTVSSLTVTPVDFFCADFGERVCVDQVPFFLVRAELRNDGDLPYEGTFHLYVEGRLTTSRGRPSSG